MAPTGSRRRPAIHRHTLQDLHDDNEAQAPDEKEEEVGDEISQFSDDSEESLWIFSQDEKEVN